MKSETKTSPLSSNASVHASAGSGKTYLLVSRVIRLLLLGTSPASILAITFTRKAAAEMQVRLMERLYSISTINDDQLSSELTKLDVEDTDEIRLLARRLYETLLHNTQSVRVTTFHAFCQELLRRFPFEADVPPGFELIDKTATPREEAWHALMSDAASNNKTSARQYLQALLKIFSPTQTHKLLEQFLSYRSDWWAFSQGKDNPVNSAIEELSEELSIKPGEDPVALFFASNAIQEKLQTYSTLLARHPTKPNLKILDNLSLGQTEENQALDQRLKFLTEAFFTTTNSPRKHKDSGVFRQKLGDDGVNEFYSLHDELCELIENVHRQQAAINLLEINSAWMSAGQAYLDYYQRIKNEQRLLDFSDLEWKTYQLLNHANNALWIQYKLDEQIDHLLIDEFQDTNPTQWHLILPLLNELAAGDSGRNRSVFLVGDAKQSIYRFRRANARLFNQASEWIEKNLDALRHPLNKSWRSSPAIINFVNTLFNDINNDEFEFDIHDTHQQQLCGRVTVLPLCKEPEDQDNNRQEHQMRNPLLEPRPEKENLRFLEEGKQIAETIHSLLEQELPVEEKGIHRPVRYRDILILFKARTHIRYYEQAFRDAGIPYLGADRGTLLESLEVNDMLNLLHWLITPYDNLALAGILKSPVFNSVDDELLQLSRSKKNNWFEALTELASQPAAFPSLYRAHQLLSRWLELAGHIPVHDLLDRIYSEANVIERYKASFPSHLATRIEANLTRFIELALEMDSGRYPSLTRFTSWIKELKQQRDEAPDAPSETSSDDRISLMTIHGAKGLEAPVVFVADSSYENQDKNASSVIVEWPADNQYPTSFMLAHKSAFTPGAIKQRLDNEQSESRREDTNLLYVAVTRARQYLYISGSQPRRGSSLGWYGRIINQHQLEPADMEEATVLHDTGSRPDLSEIIQHPEPVDVSEENLSGPFTMVAGYREIAPSRSVKEQHGESIPDEDAKTRGIIIHLMLEKICEQPGITFEQFVYHLQLAADPSLVEQCWHEAQQVIHAPRLAHVFTPENYDNAMNEVPVIYRLGNSCVHGIIDRLVISKDKIIIIDYKSHQHARKENLAQLSEPYQQQVSLYAQGIRQLWPEQRVEAYLLFTHCAELHKMPLQL